MLVCTLLLICGIIHCKPVEETVTIVGGRPQHALRANRVVATHRDVSTTLPSTGVNTEGTTLQPSVTNQDVDVSSQLEPNVENDNNYIDVNQNLRQVTTPTNHRLHRVGGLQQPAAARIGAINTGNVGTVQLSTGQRPAVGGILNAGNRVADVSRIQQQPAVVAINDPESRLGGNVLSTNNLQSLATDNGDVSTNLQPLVANTNVNDDGSNVQHVVASSNNVADVGNNFADINDAANAQHVVGTSVNSLNKNIVDGNGLEEVRPNIQPASNANIQTAVGGVNTANMQAIGRANRFTSSVSALGSDVTTTDDSAQDLATPVGLVNVNGAVTKQSYEICTLNPSPCNDAYAKQVCDVCQTGRQLASYKSPLVADHTENQFVGDQAPLLEEAGRQITTQNPELGDGHPFNAGSRVFANATLYHEDDYGRPALGNEAGLLEDKCVDDPCSCCQEVKGRNCQDVCDADDPSLASLAGTHATAAVQPAHHQAVHLYANGGPCHKSPCECCVESKQDDCAHVCVDHGGHLGTGRLLRGGHVENCHGDPCHCCHVTRQENCDASCRGQSHHLHQHPVSVHHHRILHHHHEDCDPALDHNCGEGTDLTHDTENGHIYSHESDHGSPLPHHGSLVGHYANAHHGNYTGGDDYQNHNDDVIDHNGVGGIGEAVDSSNFDFTGSPSHGGDVSAGIEMHDGDSGCKCNCNCNCDSGGGMPKIPGIEHVDFIDHDREGCKCSSEECNCPAIGTVCKGPCEHECSKKCKCPKTK